LIDKLFDQALAEKPIFKDLSVLSPHYIPEKLPHRKAEIKETIRILSPILRNEKPNNIFIYGKTGTGKTAVVRHVTRELEKIAKDPERNKYGVRACAVYMNCGFGYNTKYQVLVKLLGDDCLNESGYVDTPLSDRASKQKLVGLSPTELFERLKAVIQENSISLVIILDEVDLIKDVDELMYLLTRINDEVAQDESSSGRVSLIGISNNSSFKDALDSRSKSTLCEEEMVFKPYNANQLKTILAQRVKLGLKSGCISSSNVALISAYAAQTNGDARYALKLLQKSGEIAQTSGRKRIRTDDVKEARVKVEEDITYELISTLPEPQQIVLYSIADSVSKGGQYRRLSDRSDGVLFSGEAYEHYEFISRELDVKPRTMRWFREYLNDLEMLGLITLAGSGKGVRGNTTLIRLGNPPKEVKKIVALSLGLMNE